MDIKDAKRKYQFHKSRAAKRKVSFELSFEEWLSIWIASGQWHNRGRGKGKYNMCRIGDQGGYTVGNVFIGRHEQNAIDGQTGRKHTEQTKQKMSGPKSEIHKLNMSKGWNKRSKKSLNTIAKKNTNRNILVVTCDICGKQGGKTAMLRWHFNNCKENITCP